MSSLAEDIANACVQLYLVHRNKSLVQITVWLFRIFFSLALCRLYLTINYSPRFHRPVCCVCLSWRHYKRLCSIISSTQKQIIGADNGLTVQDFVCNKLQFLFSYVLNIVLDFIQSQLWKKNVRLSVSILFYVIIIICSHNFAMFTSHLSWTKTKMNGWRWMNEWMNE